MTARRKGGGGLVTFGESMGRISADQIGLLDTSRTFSVSVGGAESNVAVAAARLGADATWAGRLGRDSVGDLVERRLRTEGVRRRITRDDGFTGLMVCSRRTNAGVRVDYHRAGSAGSRLTPEDVGEDLIRQADVLHATGITPALGPTARTTTSWALRTAREAGVTVSLDVNYRAKLWSPREAAPVLRELVTQADIVFAGPEEAALVLGTQDVYAREPLEAARALVALGPRTAVVKDGPRGCAAVIDGRAYVREAVPVRTVDPVGAGDAFVAGYLAELLAGRDAGARLTTATRTGAYAVTVPGDCEGLPFRHELDAFTAAEDVAR
ncbi:MULTISPECIES: sugar kinase [unclassified Streptomyces]|uniref:sugar kinase n=1 Tax=unclassified Streptomyces TaxID=2593676 RepID=UPI000CD4FD04|nr:MULTISPECIES: sugar kinase [unclassified Streptomyces]AWL41267.1 sugar kinase [Streptomyces sp. SM18]